MPLREHLEAVSIYYPKDGTRRFIPRNALDDLLTEKLIRSELQQACKKEQQLSQHQISSLSKTIYYGRDEDPRTSFRKILSTLILVGLRSWIQEFVDNNVNDSLLPLLHEAEIGVDPSSSAQTIDSQTRPLWIMDGDRHRPLQFMRAWDRTSIDMLFQAQWAFLSPFFESLGSEIEHYNLTVNHILPVTEDMGRINTVLENVKEDSSQIQEFQSDVEVTCIKLHPSHYNFVASRQTEVFTLKRIPPYDKPRFAQEVQALQAAKRLQDSHIIAALATFEIPSLGYYILFPYAAGDLEFLWKTRPDLVGRSDSALWIAKQCYKLAAALAKIHGASPADVGVELGDPQLPLAIIHGDLKPANILWFPRDSALDSSDLVIADFGWAEFDSENRPEDWHPFRQIRRSYRSPESENLNAHISSASDVWTLGCTFLEFAVWHVLGWDGVENAFFEVRLDQNRSDVFFSSHEGSFTIKPQILGWVRELSEHQNCSLYVQDFMKFILERMLEVDPVQRITATNLETELLLLYERCLLHTDYCKNGSKRWR